MFIRRKKNRSGSVSVYILEKHKGKQVLVKSMGAANSEAGILNLIAQAKLEILRLSKQKELEFHQNEDLAHIENLKKSITHVRIVGTELVLNKIFDEVGFDQVPEELFRHLVLSRLVYPGSKLKTIDYLARHYQKYYATSSVYRYMDKIKSLYKDLLQDISYQHTLELFDGMISTVFYDVTTLYFEISQEDELRKIGFSKDGKALNPQIVLGLLVSEQGYPLAFEMYEGNKFEGHTFLPVLEKFKSRFNLKNLVVVADSGLMTQNNIDQLIAHDYQFIIGARIKNESAEMKQEILSKQWKQNKTYVLTKSAQIRLIITHSEKREKKDRKNREKGIDRLKAKIKSGKLSKQNINNRGYNKYLKIKGSASIELDLSKLKVDQKWDGLKGYLTNTTLNTEKILENYHQLWHIEKAFRMSKTDLRVRPIYHQKANRIEAHLIIAFCSYKIYKELERQLYEKRVDYSTEKTLEILKSIYSLKTTLPKSKIQSEIIMATTQEQKNILKAFNIPF